MVSSYFDSLAPSSVAPLLSPPSQRPASTLDGIALGTSARIVAVALEADLAAWLHAVGIGEGECMVLLRRAPFGGPLHVRTSSGGEFALARSLARAITVQKIEAGVESAV